MMKPMGETKKQEGLVDDQGNYGVKVIDDSEGDVFEIKHKN